MRYFNYILNSILKGCIFNSYHSKEYNEIKKDVFDLEIPTTQNDKKNLQKDRQKSVIYYQNAFLTAQNDKNYGTQSNRYCK